MNLIGEHTDYNEGLVLPTVLPLATTIECAPRADDEVHVRSDGFGEATYRLGEERRHGEWADYVRGVTWALREAGLRHRGFAATIRSTVPAGAGLASSAALEVALLRVLRDAFALELADVAVARVAHRAETAFVGARVGTMDQLIASLGRPGEALLIDMRTDVVERVPLPAAIALVVVDSGIAHAHAAGGYNERRAECDEAARLLGVRALRDASAADVEALVARDPVLGRRARHVLTENARVRAFARGLGASDARACGRLLDESHASLRDDFEVSLPELDVLVAALRAAPGVRGARLMGGGFGGAALAVADPDAAASSARAAVDTYRARTGRPGRVLLP